MGNVIFISVMRWSSLESFCEIPVCSGQDGMYGLNAQLTSDKNFLGLPHNRPHSKQVNECRGEGTEAM